MPLKDNNQWEFSEHRKFNGEDFKWIGGGAHKSYNDKWAKLYREMGHKVRIVKHSKLGTLIYISVKVKERK